MIWHYKFITGAAVGFHIEKAPCVFEDEDGKENMEEATVLQVYLGIVELTFIF